MTLPDHASELGNGLVDLAPGPPDIDTGMAPAIEAVSLSKCYKPKSAGEGILPWRSGKRKRKRQESRGSLLGNIGEDDGDDDDGLDDDFDLDDDDDETPAEQLTLTDGEIWALQDVNFTLAAGRSLGVLGGDGAGKSTLIQILQRVTPPSGGEVVVRGRVAPAYSVVLSMIDGRQSGVRAIFRIARFFGVPHRIAEAAVEPIRDLTQLGDLLEVATKSYSTGQLARLAYGISLCLDPDIVLLDGIPTIGDHAYRSQARAALQDRLDRGLTMVVASNDVGLVRRMCTEALLLKAGRVEAFGPADEVAALYETEFAAEAAERARATPRRVAPEPTEAEVVVNTAAFYDMRGQPMVAMRTTDDALFEMTVAVRTGAKRLRCVGALMADGAVAVRLSQPASYEVEEAGVYAFSVHVPAGTVPAGKYDGKARVLEVVGDERRSLDQTDFDLICLSTGEPAPPAGKSTALEWDVVRLS